MSNFRAMACALAAACCLALPGIPAQAHSHRYHDYHHRYHYRHHRGYARDDHGHCLRFNRTTGTVAGAVGGGLLGNALVGGTGGTLVGAAAGGVAGHELARNGRKRCR